MRFLSTLPNGVFEGDPLFSSEEIEEGLAWGRVRVREFGPSAAEHNELLIINL